VANATARVGKGSVRPEDCFTKRSSATLAAATRFYTGAMLGTVAGYLAKFDDTQSMTFAGLVRGKEGDPSLPAGTAGDGTIDLDVYQPKRFELAVSGVAVTDIGRRVWATFDNAGTLDVSATTYANLIGTIVDYVASGIALVEPVYAPANGVNRQVMGASGAVVIKAGTVFITKAGVAALTIVDPTSGVHDGVEMTFISTTAQAHTLSNAAGSGFNAGGAGTDVGTFGGAKGDGITIIAYAGVWYVKDKTNVTLA
jgi:hypothetical protein